ncbi:hypothetical protein CTAYLR_009519 [Chrysophaeum taylorii]|uniref:Spindle pole body component n=1 Tax=Chrysophaeum taylorii TaxID=2483200 RepID=A0AAD7UJU2_9STRA|nr:hypothetical protein CTAYLR_009519 [Chrysophaeum taylorii]
MEPKTTKAVVVGGADPWVLVLRYGAEVCVRSTALGRCVCVWPVERVEPGPPSVGGRGPPSLVLRFVAAVTGLGLGDREERLVVLNAKLREDRGPIRFGDAIALRSRLAREKCVGSADDDGSVTFTRNLVGAAERWELVPSGTGRVRRRGDVARSGDAVMLRSARGDGFLGAVEGSKADVCWLVREPSAATVWQLGAAGAPHWPRWHDDRPYLSGSFVGLERGPFGTSTGDDEASLVDDVLSALAGCDGGAVRAVSTLKNDDDDDFSAGISLALDDVENRSFADLAKRCLPAGEAFVRVRCFSRRRARYEYGRVSHALAAELRSYLRDYLTFLAQLETAASSASRSRRRELGLQQLWFWLQPAAKTLGLLDRLCAACSHLAGGPLLDALLAFPCADADERATIDNLAAKAAAPYLETLRAWIGRGILDDPYHEFCVAEDPTARRDVVSDYGSDYWEARFETVAHRAAGAVLKRKADQVTVTGKYWHVVRDLVEDDDKHQNHSPPPPPPPEVAFDALRADVDDGALASLLDDAHATASTHLLELVFAKEKALDLLLDLKRYFLAGQGDFLVNLLDLADSEFDKRADVVNRNRLDSLLQLAITLTSHKPSPNFKVKAALADSTLLDHLETVHSHGIADDPLGDAPSDDKPSSPSSDARRRRPTTAPLVSAADAFALELDVPWPLSIVVSRRSVVKYQLIFRHVFRLKRVSRALLAAWTDQMATKDLYGRRSRRALGAAFCLRYRMLHFVHTLTSYVMFDVVETRHDAVLAKLSTDLDTLDQALTDHDAFLDVVLRECLLTNHNLFALLADLLASCDRFAAAATRFADAALARAPLDGLDDSFRARQHRLALQRAQLERTAKAAASYFDLVNQQAASWSALFARFLDRLLAECHLRHNTHLLDLYHRLHA